jgi:hypothetical protein
LTSLKWTSPPQTIGPSDLQAHPGTSPEKKPFNPADTKKSLVSVGRSVVDSNSYSIYSAPLTDKTSRNKEKQKILAKLEEL